MSYKFGQALTVINIKGGNNVGGISHGMIGSNEMGVGCICGSKLLSIFIVENVHFLVFSAVIKQVKTRKTLDRVDYGANFELISSQNMRT